MAHGPAGTAIAQASRTGVGPGADGMPSSPAPWSSRSTG